MASFRPSDHIDSEPVAAELPKLGPVGFARFLWRQLTSMRTALVLLLLLALAAVPGSLVPQRSSDPNGVLQYQARDPEGFAILDALGLFSTFSSPWFAAIYLLLFVSLIGCIIPRSKHHFDALRARPPKTPARLSRLVGFTTADSPVDAETAVDSARRVLKGQGYRVERYASTGSAEPASISISAERGYLRETGNLVFHTALVGVLAGVGIGGGFGYNGQRLLIEGQPFANVLADYDSFYPGPWIDADSALEPFGLRLEAFDSSYEFDQNAGSWNPVDFDATMGVREQGGEWRTETLKVNSPLEVGGTQVYLLANGYAPIVTVRDPDGEVVFSGAVPFLTIDGNLKGGGVIKVPDGLSDQLGLTGFFYPDAYAPDGDLIQSFSPQITENALLTLFVYRGDLGLADGSGANVYSLDTENMEQLAGRDDALALRVGDTVDLPDGMGTIELEGVANYVGLDIHHDPTQAWVLGFALAAVGGLLTSLFIPRRRMWIKAVAGAGGVRLEYAGLARGDDPGLAAAVADLARVHADALASTSTTNVG
jgi:cytochrome c biogenesis protein